MPSDWSGRVYIDSKDIWINYGMIVESGTDGFLEFPATKPNISHDWPDQHGIDVDLSQMLLQSRQINLRCGIIADSEADFWVKYLALLSDLTQANARRIEIAEFGNQSFKVFYSTTNSFDRFTRILNAAKIACKFTLVLVEHEPVLDNSNVFIIEETGRFIIT
jgi:hypothetical protein